MKTFIIAEIGQAHDGSLGILHSYIDAISSTGVDAIKFQTHIAAAESSSEEKFRINFSYVDKTRYDYWKRMEFNQEQWVKIRDHCQESGLEFMSTPFSIEAVELLEKVGVKRYKVGSGDLQNFLMLEKIAKTAKPIILSTGISTFSQINETINFLKTFGNDISILQCTTKYPVPAEEIGLNVIKEMKDRYGLKIGLSDHSGTIFPSLAAVALGAQIIEFHTVFDKRMFGPDAKASLTIDEVRLLVEGVRLLERCLNSPLDKNNRENFAKERELFGRSLAYRKDLAKADPITFDVLETKRPFGLGIPPKDFSKILGKKVKRDIKKGEFLKGEDLE